MVTSASRFVITQYGLSAFSWEGGCYRAKTFNFYTFPRPFEGYDRRFVCQVGGQRAQGFVAFSLFVRLHFMCDGMYLGPAVRTCSCLLRGL